MRACCAALLVAGLVACGDDGPAASGGAGGHGAASSAGGGGAVATGGAPNGGASSGGGGAVATGGMATGGAGTGGAASSVPPPCPSGTTEIAVDDCAAAGPAPSAALAAAIDGATRGDVIDTAGELDAATCLPVRSCSVDAAPTLIFSDEPEYVSTAGVLYADQLGSGRYRVYVYHVNSGATRRRFTVVALNQESTAASLKVERLALTAPSSDYLAVGQAVAEQYLAAPAGAEQMIAPQTRVVVEPQLDALVADPNELVHAIFDVFLVGKVKLSIVSVAEGDDAAAVTAGLSLLPNTNLHVRGTFPLPDRLLLGRWGGGLQRVRLGADLPIDPDLVGTSFVDGGSVVLAGNFGARYELQVVDPGAPLALLVNPRAGAWTGAAQLSAGVDQSAGVIALPGGASSLADPDQAVSGGRYTENLAVSARLLTGGSSNLPVHVVVAPSGG